MSTQKRKFELFTRLQSLGFTYDEAAALRRIEMTLHRWAEAECNGDIERNETTGKPIRRIRSSRYLAPNDPRACYAIADRETGALRRCAAIIAARNGRNPTLGALSFYHQGDPRGCALYILRTGDVPAGEDVRNYYSRGVAVCC